MRNLDEIRKDIDLIDDKISALYIERMKLVNEVAIYKKENNLPVKQIEREQKILEGKTANIKEFKHESYEFFKSIMDISCKFQEKYISEKELQLPYFKQTNYAELIKSAKAICYQGIEGSYSHEATKSIFPDAKLINAKSFGDVFNALNNSDVDLGVLPLENITAGSVDEVYDLLYKNSFYIVLSLDLKVDHCLCASKNADLSTVKNVMSHYQALMQCSEFISKNKYEEKQAVNTAIAAKCVSELNDPAFSAICSKNAAFLNDLKILADDIANRNDNKTKFIVISKTPYILENSDIVSTVFSLTHEVGSLSRVLSDFSLNGLNLLKIESRPLQNGEWEYLFYVDFYGSLIDEKTAFYLKGISYMFKDFKILGNYIKLA